MKVRSVFLSLLALLPASGVMSATDSIPSGFKSPLEWTVGADVTPAYIFPTDAYLSGNNEEKKNISFATSINFRGSFRFSPESIHGILYPGLYTGFGFGPNFLANGQELLGTPASFFVFQGAPFKHFNSRLSLGYEWQFGVAAGWNDAGGDSPDSKSVVSTLVTAHMGVRLRLKYELTPEVGLSLALAGTHFSNGNTSWRNCGLNYGGLSLGVEYTPNPFSAAPHHDFELEKEADKRRWFYDIIAFGAWRKRTTIVPIPIINWAGETIREDHEILVPGKKAVAGLQFSPMLRLNRWVAVGPALDVKWDESAGIRPYWVEDTFFEDIQFEKVPFFKQVSAGISAHAELTTPIFCVNGGIGFNIINPNGDKRFYQQLTIKTFITEHLFLNIGYGLGNFKTPNHLMLGAGVRL